MRRYKWIGQFYYPHKHATVYVGFYNIKQYYDRHSEHPYTKGDILATNNPSFYKRGNDEWYESSFKEVLFPTDPTLTYYIRNSSKKYNTRKKCLTNKG